MNDNDNTGGTGTVVGLGLLLLTKRYSSLERSDETCPTMLLISSVLSLVDYGNGIVGCRPFS